MVSLTTQSLHTFDFKEPSRRGLFADNLVMRFASQIVMHIHEFISEHAGKPMYVYELPEEFHWPEACRIAAKHLRETCNATSSEYDEVGHRIVVSGEIKIITDARERVALQQLTAPVYDGVPAPGPVPAHA